MKREELKTIIEDSVKDVWYGRRSLDPVKEQTELLVEKLYPLFIQQQPTAEGAEEILLKHCRENKVFLTSNELHTILAAMNENTALHAQKIADKMVSDRLRERLNHFGNMYLRKKFYNKEMFEIDIELEVESYLKNKEI